MRFYRQTSEYTGAAAALLIALHHLREDRTSLDRETEFLIWRETVLLPTRGSSIYGLASFAKQTGVQVTAVVEQDEYQYPEYRFKRYKKTEIEDAEFMSEQHKKRAKELGVEIKTEDFTLQDVKDHIAKDHIILLRINAGVLREQKPTSKYVVVHGYEDGNYILVDPAQGEMRVDDETLQDAFETLTTKKRRDHRMLILY